MGAFVDVPTDVFFEGSRDGDGVGGRMYGDLGGHLVMGGSGKQTSPPKSPSPTEWGT